MTDLDTIIAGLSAAQREAIIHARWIHPGGQRPIALVKLEAPWPQGVAQFFTMTTDSLTPLGLAVRSALIERAAK
jgi:hypothetical protein